MPFPSNLSSPPLSSSRPTRIILVRHGQSTYNAEKRYQGSCDDSVLTDIGCDGALKTGVALQSEPISAIYTSPLKRAQQTAQGILQACDRPIAFHTHPALKEIDLPNWEGLPFKYVREHFAADYQCWRECPHQFQIQVETEAISSGGAAVATRVKTAVFPVLELYDRAQRFWAEILPRHAGQTVLVVSHGGTIRALLQTALGLDAAQFHGFQQSNCGISIVEFSHPESPQATLVAMNQTAHLGEVLPKPKDGKRGLRLVLASDSGLDRSAALAQFLHAADLDFSLSLDRPSCQALTDCILQHHPAIVQLQVARNDFPRIWQQAIAASRQSDNSLFGTTPQFDNLRPMTGLVVTDDFVMRTLVERAIGNPIDLRLVADSISVIYYPIISQDPVLQTLNQM
jgi:phosphoserine phosphatase